MLAQKRTFVEQDAQRLEELVLRARDQIRQLETEVEGYQTDVNYEKRVEAELEEAVEAAKIQLEKVRSDHNLMKGNLDEFVRAQQLIERDIVEFEKKRAVQANQIDNLRRDVERTLADVAQRRAEMKITEGKMAALVEQEQVQQQKITALEQAETKRREDITQTEQSADELQKKISAIQRGLDAKRNEFKLTKSMVESLEGFPESIKFLSQQKDWAKNCPLLSDLMFVREDFRVVIVNYLEPYLYYYVVPNVEEAV